MKRLAILIGVIGCSSPTASDCLTGDIHAETASKVRQAALDAMPSGEQCATYRVSTPSGVYTVEVYCEGNWCAAFTKRLPIG